MKLITFILLLFSAQLVTGQNFQNGDLEGKVYGFYSLPPAWEAIPYWDVACRAESVVTASPDLTSTSEPSINQGIIGIPYSGATFVSALDAAWVLGSDTITWHEGIQQSVSGFVPNTEYTLGFFQAVVKQIIQEVDGAVIDSSGSWAIYVDDFLLGVSAPSHSLLAFNNTYLNWEYRSLVFEASRSEHTFKFLPLDDDNDRTSNGPDGRLRMGIDQITIELSTSAQSHEGNKISAIFPNPTSGPLSFQLNKNYRSLKVHIFDSSGRKVVQQNFDQVQQMKLFIPGPPGLYLVQIAVDQGNKHTFRIIKM